MGQWTNGAMGQWNNGAMGQCGDGAMEQWGNGAISIARFVLFPPLRLAHLNIFPYCLFCFLSSPAGLPFFNIFSTIPCSVLFLPPQALRGRNKTQQGIGENIKKGKPVETNGVMGKEPIGQWGNGTMGQWGNWAMGLPLFTMG